MGEKSRRMREAERVRSLGIDKMRSFENSERVSDDYIVISKRRFE